MALNQLKKDKIAEVIKVILASRLESFPQINHQNRNAPFHDLILRAFERQLKTINIPTPYLIAISSWLHGLSTSLGSGFESLAHILSGGYKRTFTGKFGLDVTEIQAKNIEMIIRSLKKGHEFKPNVNNENKLIFDMSILEKSTNSLGFVVDNYIENNEYVEGIEMKSVRPNSGEGRGEKQKILYAKAALKKLHPGKNISYYIGFPFDPTSKTPTGYDKERFFNYLIEFKKFFDPREVLLASELWDHLSSQKNTMEEIFEIIIKTTEIIIQNK